MREPGYYQAVHEAVSLLAGLPQHIYSVCRTWWMICLHGMPACMSELYGVSKVCLWSLC